MRVSRTAVLLLAAGSFATLAACRRPDSPFNVANARAHVEQLAGRIGSRPAGTDANARARAYLIEQLRLYGFSVRVQDAEAVRPEHGLTGQVHNIIAFKAGSRAEAVGLVAHYDSVPHGPGAGDDGIGVAVTLESARLLGARDRLWSLLVLFTDAEEHGLLGAAAAVKDEEIRRRLKVYVNVEAVGTAGPGVLFQAGPGNAWMLRTWASASPEPRGASYFNEIYQRLPNDTDFTILQREGFPGLNFAAVGNSYAYHTPLDTPDRVSDEVLEGLGRTVVAWTDALEERDITIREPASAVFFDLAGLLAGAWSQPAWRLLDLAALVAALLGWLRLLLTVGRRVRPLGLALTGLWTLAGALAVAGAALGAVALLRAVREVYHPWYAHPSRTFLLILLAGASGGWVVFRLAAHLPARVRLARAPDLFWLPALTAWTALALAAAWAAPAAAYLWTLPAGAAGALIGLTTGHRRRLVIASWMVAIVAALLWLPNALDVLPFFVPVFGRLPLVMPLYVLPVLVLAPALMVAPPIVAALAGGRGARPRYVTRFLLTATVFVFAWAYAGVAYTTERPERRMLRYTADVERQEAYWEVGGTEPGLGIEGRAPGGWRPAGPFHPLGAFIDPLPFPFVFIARAPSAPPPLAAVYRTRGDADRVQLEVEISPGLPGLRVMLLLPEGIVPHESNYPGRLREGRWVAVYAAPTGPVVFRLVLPPGSEDRLDELRAAAVTPVPGAVGAGTPPWAPEGRATWTARATYLLPVAPAPRDAPAPGTLPPLPPLADRTPTTLR